MGLRHRFYLSALVTAVALTALAGEAEGKTRLVQGRKTITRTYYTEPAIPAWASVTLVGVAILIFGGLLYVVLHKVYLFDYKYYMMHQVPQTDDLPA